jgi:hypothetical protein
MPKPFYQPIINGQPCRCFATRTAATRWIRRSLRRDPAPASLLRFVSPSQPGIVVATFGPPSP